MRVAVVFDNFGPYHVARLAAAARRMDVLAVEVRPKSKVYDWNSPQLPPGLHRVTLTTSFTSKVASWHSIKAALDEKVGRWKPDAIAVAGWSGLPALATADWAGERDLPAILMSESNAQDARRIALVESMKQLVVRQFSSGLCGGEWARTYLCELGLPPDAVFLGYNSIDNDYFSSMADAVRSGGGMPVLQNGEPLDGKWRGRYFLASARFVPVKNLGRLIEAYSRYRVLAANAGEPWPLVILGDGALRGELERQRSVLGLERDVHLPGFRQYDELPQFYGTAGALVHASTMEPWGLVVNEAMASGLPVLVSDRCGCAETLVADGVNGFAFSPEDVDVIATVMLRLATHPNLASLGEASRRKVSAWGPDRFGDGLLKAAAYARQHVISRHSASDRMVLRMAAVIQSHRT